MTTPIAGLEPIIDPNYRYKMELPQIKYQGEFTIITNLPNIAKNIHRELAELMKALQFGLNTSAGIYDENCGQVKYKGIFNLAMIQQILAKYIHFFVLCGECAYPETHYDYGDVEKKKKKSTKPPVQHCNSCGATTKLPSEKNTQDEFLLKISKFVSK
jgi:translation initiation factor 2 beta subunit (eIF-2beta)/eIF-5